MDNVPFVQQEGDFCGPAGLASVLAYYGQNISQHDIAKVVFDRRLKGSLISDLKKYAENQGFNAEFSSGDIDKIKYYIDQRKPVIALIDIGFFVFSRPHYVVVFGYDDKGFLCHFGYIANQKIGFEKFKRMWNKLGNTYLVIYP
ncbi:MAG: C39 family peptidase [Proteobacteria bacterium]|nr:C39 family peptidase [Pseudomonadota bacterium]